MDPITRVIFQIRVIPLAVPLNFPDYNKSRLIVWEGDGILSSRLLSLCNTDIANVLLLYIKHYTACIRKEPVLVLFLWELFPFSQVQSV